ncbi:MAG: hypothetical protein JWP66_707 [Naasia sp.]|nr:hypothetical protein [Naasia sp.]
MRWDSLFDDLEGQLERELAAEGEELRAEEERLRIGRLALRDRIRGAAEHGPVRLRLVAGEPVTLEITAIGRDWLSGEPVDGRRCGLLVPLPAVAALLLAPEQVPGTLAPAGEEAGLTARLGFPFVLRDLARRRVPVEVRLAGGTVAGTIDRVARDTVDVAVHEPDAGRCSPRRVEIVALSAVLAVRVP